MSDAFDPHPPSARTLAELHARWPRVLAALDAARTAATRAIDEQRVASSSVKRQQVELESVHESAQKLSARGREIRTSLQLVRESMDRAKLTALNAGLEGARLGDPAGKALVVMADEVRGLLARALDALDEHSVLLAEVDRDRERCLGDLAQLSDGTRSAAGALSRAEQQSQLNNALLSELKVDLSELWGADPETARVLSEASVQLKTTADALRALCERSPLGESAVRELLRPLLSLLPGKSKEDAP